MTSGTKRARRKPKRAIFIKRCEDCGDMWTGYQQSRQCVVCGGKMRTIQGGRLGR